MAELTVPKVDFAPLGQLGEIYKQSMNEQGLKDAFSQGVGNDPQSLAALAQKVAPYNPQMGINLAQLAHTIGRQGAQDARVDATNTFNQRMDQENLRLRQNADRRAAEAANEGSYVIKEVQDPNTGRSSFVRMKVSGAEGAVNTGLPQSPDVNPNLNQKSPFNQALLKEDAGRVTEYSQDAKKAEGGISQLDYIDNVRDKAYTGVLAGPIANKLGHPATQALEGATNALALDVAQNMKGALSDKDIPFVKSQVGGVGTGGEAGKAASGIIRAAYERKKQMGAFYRTWAEKNGNINGADAAWSRYTEENPLTTDDKTALGGRKFNPSYNKNFSRYIKGGQSGSGNGADSMLAYARDALAQGAPRKDIEERLRGAGIDPKDL
jgi:hypothetical protein